MVRRIARCSTAVVMALLISACGFQLRGTSNSGTVVPDSWKSMHLVTSNPNSEFSREVKARFAANGIDWADASSANYRVVLHPERFSQRNLSLNSEARVAEFELTMQSKFSVTDARNNTVMPETNVSIVRQMENDPRNVVGKAEEIRILQSEMRMELAEQIMRRIGFYAASTQ